MKTLLDLLGWNATRPLIVFNSEPKSSSSGGGGSSSGTIKLPSTISLAQSAVQGVQSVTKDPAVAKTGADKGTQTRGSSPKPPTQPTALEKKVYDVTGSIARDLNMGFSTLFQSKEKQAETLRNKGYSDDVIADYQARTEASKARMAAMTSNDNDDYSSPTTTTSTTGTTGTTGATGTTGTTASLDTDTNAALTNVEDISTQTFSEDADFSPDVSVGEAEDKAIDLMKKGRRATILTKSGGLLGTGGEGKTRRRRSLIGG